MPVHNDMALIYGRKFRFSEKMGYSLQKNGDTVVGWPSDTDRFMKIRASNGKFNWPAMQDIIKPIPLMGRIKYGNSLQF